MVFPTLHNIYGKHNQFEIEAHCIVLLLKTTISKSQFEHDLYIEIVFSTIDTF
jgi:hypothetical protein